MWQKFYFVVLNGLNENSKLHNDELIVDILAVGVILLKLIELLILTMIMLVYTVGNCKFKLLICVFGWHRGGGVQLICLCSSDLVIVTVCTNHEIYKAKGRGYAHFGNVVNMKNSFE